MSKFIDARVIQKTDTEEKWSQNDLKLYKGELALVQSADDVVNIKVGTGNKTFRELPYLINYVSGLYTKSITRKSRPSGDNYQAYIATEVGEYPNFGNVEVPKGFMGVIFKNLNNFEISLIKLPNEEELQEYINEQLVDANLGFGGQLNDLNQSPTVEGIYIPKIEGTYPNFNNLTYDSSEGLVMFLYKDGQYQKIAIPLDVVDNEVKNINTSIGVSGQAVEKFAVKKINNIAELRNTQGEYEGQLIELLGYYEAGEYSLKYKWTNTQAADDGGYVINSDGGSWLAELITELKSDYYGIVNNGITDETSKYVALLNKANELGFKVKIKRGVIKINPSTPIRINTSVDFNSSTLLINNDNINSTIFNIESYNTWKVIDHNSFKSKLIRGQRYISELANYKNHLVRITSDEVMCMRHDGDNSYDVLKTDVFFVLKGGYFNQDQLLNDFTTGNIEVRVREYDWNTINIENLFIDFKLDIVDKYCVPFHIERTNVNILNINLTPSSSNVTTIFRRGVFEIHNSYRVFFNNVMSENIVSRTTGSSLGSGYIFDIRYSSFIFFEKINSVSGWGVFGGHFIKNIYVKESTINRFDCHIGCVNIYLDKVYILGGWGVFLGYGLGEVVLKDCTSDLDTTDVFRTSVSAINIAATYGLKYEGVIKVYNHTIKSRMFSDKLLIELMDSVSYKDYKLAYDVKFPSVYVDGLFFDNIENEKIIIYSTKDGSSPKGIGTSVVSANKKLVLPSNIVVSNVRIRVENDKSYCKVTELLFDNSTVNYLYGDTCINVSNVNNSVIHSDLIEFNLKKDHETRRLVNFVDSRYTTGSTESHSVLVYNCNGGIRYYGKLNTFSIDNSNVESISVYGAKNNVTIKNSNVYFSVNQSTLKQTMSVDKLILSNNIIYSLNSNSTPTEFTETNSDTALLYNNNVIGGKINNVSDLITNKLYNYQKSGNFKLGIPQASNQELSTATDINGLNSVVNSLIVKLKDSKQMKNI